MVQIPGTTHEVHEIIDFIKDGNIGKALKAVSHLRRTVTSTVFIITATPAYGQEFVTTDAFVSEYLEPQNTGCDDEKNPQKLFFKDIGTPLTLEQKQHILEYWYKEYICFENDIDSIVAPIQDSEIFPDSFFIQAQEIILGDDFDTFDFLDLKDLYLFAHKYTVYSGEQQVAFVQFKSDFLDRFPALEFALPSPERD